MCGAYGGLYPYLSRINFLGPSFFRNKFPFPKKGTTPRRTCYTKNIQNQFWDHGGKHLWIKFQWPRSYLSLCKSPTNSAPRNSTLFFGCNPSVAEYFSMGQPPSTLKIPKLGLNKCPRGIIFRAQGQEKNPARTNPVLFVWLSHDFHRLDTKDELFEKAAPSANSGQPSVPNKHVLVWLGSQPCLARYLEGLSTAGMLQPWGAAQLLDQTSNIGDVLRFGSESVARGKLDVLTCKHSKQFKPHTTLDPQLILKILLIFLHGFRTTFTDWTPKTSGLKRLLLLQIRGSLACLTNTG